MAGRRSSWLHEMFYVWMQYLAVAIAAIPAGLIHFGLVKAGISETASLLFSALVSLGIGYLIWKVLFAKKYPVTEPLTGSPITASSMSFLFDSGNKPAFAWSGAVMAVSAIAFYPSNICLPPSDQECATTAVVIVISPPQ